MKKVSPQRRRGADKNKKLLLVAEKTRRLRQLLLGNSSCITLLHTIHGAMHCSTYGRPVLIRGLRNV